MKMIKIIGKKTLYNTDNSYPASEWVREELNKKSQKDKVIFPHLSSGIKISPKDNQTLFKGSLGSVYFLANNISENTQGVSIASTIQTMGSASISNSILPENFYKVVALFSARRLIQANWTNWTDEYLAPDESNPKFKEFVNDSVIFSLFESKSNQSSLRNMEYKNKKWDIKNEFFWMSKQEIAQLAKDNNNEDCYDDAISSDDRYVYKYLQRITLSPEAQAVLDYANKLVRDSFKYREDFNKNHPEYQINNWDCGYYQLKFMWKEYMPEEFAEFRALYNKLAEKMRPMVYELGFLKK